MVSPDDLLGIRRPDLTELKEVKVKLPVKVLLRLHFLKLTSSRNFSEIVEEALCALFEARKVPVPADAGSGKPDAATA